MADAPPPPPGFQLVTPTQRSAAPPPPPGFILDDQVAPVSLPPSPTGGLQGGIGPSYDELGRKLMRVGPNGQAGGQSQAQPQVQFPAIDFSQPVEKVREEIAKLPEPLRPQAVQEWAKSFVEKEHADSPISSAVGDKVRQLTRGTLGLGSWLDEANAALPIFGSGGSDYGERKAYQDARDKYADEHSTKIKDIPLPGASYFGKIPLIGNADVGDLTKLAGGALSVPLAPGLNAGVSVGGQMLKQGGMGMLYGAAHGAGEGNTTGERIGNATGGALTGGVLGAAAPPVARGVSNGLGSAWNAVRPLPRDLRGMSPDAVRKMAGYLDADRVPISATGAPLKVLHNQPGGPGYGHGIDLGHEGMLGDLGPSLESNAMGLAAETGSHQPILQRALEARDGAATARLTHDINATVGHPQNIPQVLEDRAKATAKATKPLYDQFHNTAIQLNQKLQAILVRAGPGVIKEAERKLERDGLSPGNAAGYNARLLDYVKRTLDDQASVAKRAGAKDDYRSLSNLARELRDEVDNILDPASAAAKKPTNSIWKKARDIHADKEQLAEATELGRTIFKRKDFSPDEMAHELRGLDTPSMADAYRMGARQAIRDAMGSKGTRFGPGEDTGAMQLLGNQYARDKLALLLGRQQSGRLINRLQAEGAFAETHGNVLRNSLTARRLAARDNLRSDAKELTSHATAYSDVKAIVKGLVDHLAEGAVTARRQREMTDMARMQVAQGADRNAIVRGLNEYLRRGGLSQQRQTAIRMTISRLVHGSQSPAIDNKSTKRAAAR